MSALLDYEDNNPINYPGLNYLDNINYSITDTALIIESIGVDQPKSQEILFNTSKTVLIPDNFTFQISPDGFVFEVILFASVLDLLSFIHLYKIDNKTMYMAIGKYPAVETLKYIRENYSYAKITLCFPKDLFFVIQEIRTVNILRDKAIKFFKEDNTIICKNANKSTCLDIRNISLSAYKKQNGGFSKFKTKKPKGFKSFLDQFYSKIP